MPGSVEVGLLKAKHCTDNPFLEGSLVALGRPATALYDVSCPVR